MAKIETKKGCLKYYIYKDTKNWPEPGSTAFIELVSIFVKPEFRKQGVGMKLIKKLEKIAQRNHITSIETKANTDGRSDVFGKFLTKNKFSKTNYITFEKVI